MPAAHQLKRHPTALPALDVGGVLAAEKRAFSRSGSCCAWPLWSNLLGGMPKAYHHDPASRAVITSTRRSSSGRSATPAAAPV